MLTMLSCTPTKERVSTNDATSQTEVVSLEISEKETQSEQEDMFLADSLPSKSLNDIRFAGWTDRDWLDNDYIRELRKHIDAYLNGQMPNLYPDHYKEHVKGIFVIVNIEPCLLGGVFV